VSELDEVDADGEGLQGGPFAELGE